MRQMQPIHCSGGEPDAIVVQDSDFPSRMSAPNLNVYNASDVVSYYASMSFISPCEEMLFTRYIRAGASVLDMGVGGGRTTAYVAAMAAHYVGVDYAEEMIRICQSKFPHLEFRHADASDLSCFPASSFDVVLMPFNGIDYLSSDGRLRCLQECLRVLKTRGTFIFSSHNPRAILVRATWSNERVQEVADRIFFGHKTLSRITSSFLTVGAALRASMRATWASLRRSKRLINPAFWRGEGYFNDPAHGGLTTHVSIPKCVVAEVEKYGFRPVEMQPGDYPAASHELFTKWYYYVFLKPETK